MIEVTASRLAEDLKEMLGGATPYLVGFENHGGRTKLGKTEALGRVVYGLGNNGEDSTEGHFIRMRSQLIPMVLCYRKIPLWLTG